MSPTDDATRGPDDGALKRRPDPDLQPDVERIHRPLRREPHDPIEGREPAPWFFNAAVALALFWGGWYLGRYGGEFDTTPHIAMAVRERAIESASEHQTLRAVNDPVAAGKVVYENNCLSCHQAAGQGVPGVFPPLAGSEWVVGAPETLVQIILHGLQGPLQVAGTSYNGAMPAWKDVLRTEEIAAVATYIRQMPPNQGGAVAPALVTQVQQAQPRTKPWTAPELQQPAGGP
jgi:mono/diheme cytochrome c family protein